ncbi:hypothetical protein MNBD_GAMMA09-2685 [hydrothermal vent metagenome]|uniref:Uncharacterized protein n=1 Tax=hydrothermal vent metagenome TaxID=652676 RepID=A0A3B0Y2S7_9ZZZZ
MYKNEINKLLDNVYIQVKEGEYESALKTCDDLLTGNIEHKDDILRMRSQVHAYQNNIREALIDREEIILCGVAKVQDYYFSSQYLLELGLYAKTVDVLSDGIDLCEKLDVLTYRTDMYLLRAYSYMHVKEYLLARSDCNKVEDDSEFLIDNIGFITKNELLNKISCLAKGSEAS